MNIVVANRLTAVHIVISFGFDYVEEIEKKIVEVPCEF